VGPVEGIAAADQMWMSRYIMHRVCEQFGVTVSFHPKPILGDWNGSGAHHNFSTAAMREKGGYDVILKSIERLGAKHREHISVYGAHNELRLTGKHETASMEAFSYGVANRGASIRIPRQTHAEGYGYFEDRRPASNVDPYLSTGIILATACGLPGGEALPAALEASRNYHGSH
jgi:glutamine synthetase